MPPPGVTVCKLMRQAGLGDISEHFPAEIDFSIDRQRQLSVGRSADCAISIPNDKTFSKNHCVFELVKTTSAIGGITGHPTSNIDPGFRIHLAIKDNSTFGCYIISGEAPAQVGNYEKLGKTAPHRVLKEGEIISLRKPKEANLNAYKGEYQVGREFKRV
jgi:hypothetical protein